MTANLERERRLIRIRELLGEEEIGSQEELAGRLLDEGFQATQSSISRDLRELAAAKVRGAYRLPPGGAETEAQTLAHSASLIRRLATAGPHLLVVTTAVGAAARVALALDRAGFKEVVGTLAGDDTVFVATAGAAAQQRLRRRLRRAMGKT